MWDFQRAYLGYEVRVSSYASLLYDEYPNFGSTWRDEPVAFGFDFRPDANRLTSALRLIWIIPAMFISFFLGIAVFFILFVSWVVIIVTGRHPRGMWDFTARVYRFSFELSAYAMLMTDEYPRYDGFGADEHAPARRPPRVIRQHPAEHRDAAPAAVGSAGWLTETLRWVWSPSQLMTPDLDEVLSRPSEGCNTSAWLGLGAGDGSKSQPRKADV